MLGSSPGTRTAEASIKLARALAKDARVVLVGIDPKTSAIGAISNDPSTAGMAELAAGAASFRDIIGKDQLSGAHVITPGRAPWERVALLSSPRLAANFDALARSYDYVLVDAGAAEGVDLEAIGEIAPQAVLLADKTGTAAELARERLLAADFEDVMVLSDALAGSATAAAA